MCVCECVCVCECRNSKQVPVSLIVTEVFPASSDTRIKVQLVEPSQSAVDEGTQQEETARGGAFDDAAVGEVTSVRIHTAFSVGAAALWRFSPIACINVWINLQACLHLRKLTPCFADVIL